jgi:RNA polymerase sigma-70 factor (ECF subfamily)
MIDRANSLCQEDSSIGLGFLTFFRMVRFSTSAIICALREPIATLRCISTGRSKTTDEAALIASASRGDVGAFEALIRRYQDDAFRAAYLVLRDAAEAEDATQEAMVKAHNAIGRFREGSTFRPWLLKIVVNQSLTQLRRRKRRAELAEAAGRAASPAFESLDETVISRERAAAIWDALQSLKDHERVAVYLRYFLALPERELAEYLGVAPGTVKSRLHRGLAHLREALASRAPELAGEMT